MIDKELLTEIIQDTSFNGKYIMFYESLEEALDDYSLERINRMKDTLKYVYPKKSDKIDKFDKMKTLYEYSKLI